MDHLSEESKKRQRQRRRIKNCIEVKDLKEHVKDRSKDEELKMKGIEKQSSASNYVVKSLETRWARNKEQDI